MWESADGHESTKPAAGGALGHLTPDQLEGLINRYYAGEAVAGLLAEYRISCPASRLSDHFPPEVAQTTCPHCDSRLLRNRVARTSHSTRWWRCSTCGHFDAPRCRCASCQSLEADRLESRRRRTAAAIEAFCALVNRVRPPMLAPEDLSPPAGIALLTLQRTANCLGSDLMSLRETSLPLAPTDALTEELLTLLHGEGLIWIDSSSTPEAFVVNEQAVSAFHPRQVTWSIADSTVVETLHEVERRATRGELASDWTDAALLMHGHLAEAEVRAYFDKCLQQRGLPYNESSKVESLIRNLLIDHSVSQALRIVWGGAQQTADFLTRKQVNRAHASNYAIGACQRWADRARASGWTVNGFKRPFDLPRSMLSHVLHDVILKIGDRGFERPRSELFAGRCALQC